jgi:Flp pilus assembly pilin Flp
MERCSQLLPGAGAWRSGQSLVEYAVLLALVAVIVFTVVAGIGQRSQGRIAQANEALEEAAVASRTSAAGARPAAAGTAHRPPQER